jgi:hypothetical protein
VCVCVKERLASILAPRGANAGLLIVRVNFVLLLNAISMLKCKCDELIARQKDRETKRQRNRQTDRYTDRLQSWGEGVRAITNATHAIVHARKRDRKVHKCRDNDDTHVAQLSDVDMHVAQMTDRLKHAIATLRFISEPSATNQETPM